MTEEVWIRCTRCGQRMLRANAVYLSGHPYGPGCAAKAQAVVRSDRSWRSPSTSPVRITDAQGVLSGPPPSRGGRDLNSYPWE